MSSSRTRSRYPSEMLVPTRSVLQPLIPPLVAQRLRAVLADDNKILKYNATLNVFELVTASSLAQMGGNIDIGGSIAGTTLAVLATEENTFFSRINIDEIKRTGTFVADFVVRAFRATGTATITVRLRDETNATILGAITYSETTITTKTVSITSTLPSSGVIDVKVTIQGDRAGGNFYFGHALVEYNNT